MTRSSRRLGAAGHPVQGAPTQAALVDDMNAWVGTTFATEPFSVAEREVARFESVTWVDRHPLSPAAEASYPADLIEGFHLLSLLDPLITPLIPRDSERTFLVNYGVDRARFVSPAVAQQRLLVRGSVVEAVGRGERGCLVRIACSMQDADDGAPVAVADWLVLILPALSPVDDEW